MSRPWEYLTVRKSTLSGKHRRSTGAAIRARLGGRLTGRRRYVAVAAVLLVGTGVAGGTVLAADAAVPAAERTDVPFDAAERAEAAARADRSERSAAGPPVLRGDPSPVGSAPAEPAEAAAPKPAATRAAKATRKPAPAWTNPLPRGRLTSCYGARWGTLHAGIDLAAPTGTPVRAAGAGRVTRAGWSGGYGIAVLVDHGDGHFTHYAHLSAASVSVGDRLATGQRLGASGSTGNSTGPHLHFEVHKGADNKINPAGWMRKRGVDLGC